MFRGTLWTVVVLLALASLASGCREAEVRPAPVPVSSPTVAPVAGPVAFRVQLGAGQRLTFRSPEPGRCPGLNALVDLGAGGTVRLAAYADGCDARGNLQPGNGRHGVFRTTADIPVERRSGAVTVTTALGEATVFDQPYYECTNKCKNYVEPVAVITLAHPDDPAFPALTVYSERGSIGRDRLTAFLRDQLVV